MELRLISLDVPEINDVAIRLSNLSGAVAVDTYADTEAVFWTDTFEDTISTAQLDVSAVCFRCACTFCVAHYYYDRCLHCSPWPIIFHICNMDCLNGS